MLFDLRVNQAGEELGGEDHSLGGVRDVFFIYGVDAMGADGLQFGQLSLQASMRIAGKMAGGAVGEVEDYIRIRC